MPKASDNNKPYSGQFQHIDFPAYEYQHYPLMLVKGGGKHPNDQLVVENEAEEKAALEDGWKLVAKVGPVVNVTQKELSDKDDEIARLKAELEAARAPAKPQAAAPPVKPPVVAAASAK